MIDPDRDSISGKWVRNRSVLTLAIDSAEGQVPTGIVMIPVRIEGAYEFEIEFSGKSLKRYLKDSPPSYGVGVTLPINGSDCFLTIGPKSIQFAQGINAKTVPKFTQSKFAQFLPDRNYKLRMRVEPIADDRARLSCRLDESLVFQWSGNVTDFALVRSPGETSSSKHVIQLRCDSYGELQTGFYAARLRMLSGTAKVQQFANSDVVKDAARRTK